jgi:hypothetical protein
LSHGIYDCTSCTPKIHIKADGSDQPTSPGNTVAVTETDSKTTKITMKFKAHIISEEVAVVSPDGQTLHSTITIYPLKGATPPVVQEATSVRVGQPVPNANAISGAWRLQKASVPENHEFVTFKSNGDELSQSSPSGAGWTARFDGKDYPVKGSLRADSISLLRLGDRGIERTYKLGGHILRVDDLTVSDDGKTMTIVSQHNPNGHITTQIATRQ